VHRLPAEGGAGGGGGGAGAGGGGGVSEVRRGRLLVRLEGDEWEMLALPHTSSPSLVPLFCLFCFLTHGPQI
jgi:hypothetical protein